MTRQKTKDPIERQIAMNNLVVEIQRLERLPPHTERQQLIRSKRNQLDRLKQQDE